MDTPPVQDHRQDRRARRSQEALTSALLTLMQKMPLQDISVHAITEQADVNRSTFYAHYTDKYDLFQACVRMWFEDMLQERLATVQGDMVHTLLTTTCAFFGRMVHGCSPKEKQLEPIVETEVQQVIFAYLLDWLQAGFGEQEAEESLRSRAMVISWVIFGTGIEYRQRLYDQSPEDVAQDIAQQLAAPLLPGYVLAPAG